MSRSGALYELAVNERLTLLDPRVRGVLDGATDNVAAFARAFALMPQGGELWIPPPAVAGGFCGLASPLIVPEGVTLSGSGYESVVPMVATQPNNVPTHGTIIRPLPGWNNAANPVLVQVGTANTANPGPGQSRPFLKDLMIDGNGLVDTPCKMLARYSEMTRCRVQKGLVDVLQVAGQGCALSDMQIAGLGTTDGLHQVAGGNDLHLGGHGRIIDCSTGVHVDGVGGFYGVGSWHIFTGVDPANGFAATSQDVRITTPADGADIADIIFNGFTFEQCHGNMIQIVAGANTVIQGLSIVGCFFYLSDNAQMTSDTYACVKLDASAAGAFINDYLLGNLNYWGGTFEQKSFVWELGSIGRRSMENIRANPVQHFGTWGSATTKYPPVINDCVGVTAASVNKFTNAKSTKLFSGDGVTTTFLIPHNLDDVPGAYTAEEASAAAGTAGIAYRTADATNITVVFTVPPANGVNNVKIAWSASLAN